jgi:hypothetical protein
LRSDGRRTLRADRNGRVHGLRRGDQPRREDGTAGEQSETGRGSAAKPRRDAWSGARSKATAERACELHAHPFSTAVPTRRNTSERSCRTFLRSFQ